MYLAVIEFRAIINKTAICEWNDSWLNQREYKNMTELKKLPIGIENF